MASKITRSRRLQKTEHIYMKYLNQKKSKVRTPRKSRRKIELKPTETVRRKHTKRKTKLNNYQKFVKEESKKDKYNGVSSSERFVSIALQWELDKKIRKIKR